MMAAFLYDTKHEAEYYEGWDGIVLISLEGKCQLMTNIKEIPEPERTPNSQNALIFKTFFLVKFTSVLLTSRLRLTTCI